MNGIHQIRSLVRIRNPKVQVIDPDSAAALSGSITWTFGFLILTNDLIWWIPFTLILHAAWKHHSGRDRLTD